MKVSARERDFNIYDLFCHDNNSTEVTPFDQYSLMARLNEKAEELFPKCYVEFVSPDESGLSQWNVRFHSNKYGQIDEGLRFETYPIQRVYNERVFRRLIPVELDEVLLELNKESIVL